MTAVRVLVGTDLRRRWASWIATALLIGVAGAVVLGAFAGARRTASVISRSARHDAAEDLSFGPDVETTPRAWPRIDRLPGIAMVTTVRGLIAVPIRAQGPDVSWMNGITAFPSDARLLRTIDRPRMLAGRLPRPDRAGEVFVDETFARRHRVTVGQRFPLVVLGPSEFDTIRSAGDIPADRHLEVTVTGIGRLRDEATRDPQDPQIPPEVVFTPAATRRFADISPPTWDLKAVRLRPGTTITGFEHRVRSLLAGIPVTIAERPSADRRAGRAMRPYVVTLLAFAVLAGIAAIAVVGQLLGRQQAARRDDRRILHAMGMRRAEFGAVGALTGLVIGTIGAVIAVIGAVALSPLAPIGPLRRLEPHPGLVFDPTVLLGGAMAIVALTTLRVTLGAARPIRRPAPRRVHRVVDALARSLPPAMGTGLRLATPGGGQDGGVPLRSTMVGLCTALAAVSATLVYAGGLTHFVETPRLFGWHWDALVAPDDTTTIHTVRSAVRHDPHVGASTPGQFGQVTIHGTTVPALGIRGAPNVEIVRGRAPTRDDEIALGATTIRNVGSGIGHQLLVRGPGGPHRFRVTGTAVFPRLAPYPAAEPTGLGTGAALTPGGLHRLVPNARDDFVLVSFHAGSGTAPTSRSRLAAAVFTRDNPGRVLGPQRPNDVTSYDRVARTPLALAGLLAFLALATAAHVLVTSVRRRRSELAVLKTLGFSRRQVSASVATQATAMIGLAAVIAVPIGIVAGTWAWGGTALWLGIPVEQAVPVGALAGVVVVAILLANVIAFVPGRMAARIRPSVALRAE